MSAPFADPSQVFGQGGPPPDAEQPGEQMVDPSEQAEPQQEEREQPIDLEGAIAHAIEAGCESAVGALTNSGEEYQRMCAGVESLANALKALQPQPDPAAAAQIQADQRMASEVVKNRREIEVAGLKAHSEANRPAAAQPSARG